MSQPIWLSVELVIAFDDEQLREFGGLEGLRDRSMLESEIARRPRNKWAYGESDLAKLAAAYPYGLARNHPIVDGNKRASLLSVYTFLGLNGIDFRADVAQADVIFRDLAAGEIDEDGLSRWLRDN